jgi:C4-dicarboxylate-specific signal transduction histidine kinase
MPTIQLQANLSPDDLLRAVNQMEPGELEEFVSRVLALRASRRARVLSVEETALLQRINQGLPPEVMSRYTDLIARRQARQLTPEEHQELIDLSDRAERLGADRVAALGELAQLRQVSLDQLMKELDIRPVDVEPHG